MDLSNRNVHGLCEGCSLLGMSHNDVKGVGCGVLCFVGHRSKCNHVGHQVHPDDIDREVRGRSLSGHLYRATGLSVVIMRTSGGRQSESSSRSRTTLPGMKYGSCTLNPGVFTTFLKRSLSHMTMRAARWHGTIHHRCRMNSARLFCRFWYCDAYTE